MDFSTLLSDYYSRLRYAASPASVIVSRAKRHHNEAHREILALPGMMRLREETITITTTASQPRTSLPQAVGRIRYLTDHTNNWRLKRVSLSQLRTEDPGRLSTAGNPLRYAEVGWRPVALQPSAAAELFVKSDAAGDTNTAYLEGVRSDGSIVSLSKVMTGVTAVSFSAVETAIVEVTKFYLSAAAVGNVTLNQTSGAGTELARISIGQTFARYLTVEWDPIPTGASTFYLDYIRNVFDLINNGDEPLLPLDFHYLVGLRARMKEYEVLDDTTRYTETAGEYERGKSALRSWVLNDGDQLASLRRETGLRWSMLGPMYPAGS